MLIEPVGTVVVAVAEDTAVQGLAVAAGTVLLAADMVGEQVRPVQIAA